MNSSPTPRLVAVSTSLKAGPSASRALIEHALASTSGMVHMQLLDLREHALRQFDGSNVLAGPAQDLVASTIASADGLLLAVPCYWNGVSGVVKNLIDVVCGPSYDLDGPTPLAGTPVAVVVVGADSDSARYGAEDIVRVLTAIGAEVVDRPVVVSNPRRQPVSDLQLHSITRLAVRLAQSSNAKALS